MSESLSSQVNLAYTTLKEPHTRALYLVTQQSLSTNHIGLLAPTVRSFSRTFHPTSSSRISLPLIPLSHLAVFVIRQLSLIGVDYGEGSGEADSSLLLEVMELREQVEWLKQQMRQPAQHSSVQSSLSQLQSVVSSRIADIERRLSVAFDSSDYNAAKAGVGELAYFNNINKEILQLQTVK